MRDAAAPAFRRGAGPSAAPQLFAQHSVAGSSGHGGGRPRPRRAQSRGARGACEGLRRGYHRREERLTLVEGSGAPGHIGTDGRQAEGVTYKVFILVELLIITLVFFSSQPSVFTSPGLAWRSSDFLAR